MSQSASKIWEGSTEAQGNFRCFRIKKLNLAGLGDFLCVWDLTSRCCVPGGQGEKYPFQRGPPGRVVPPVGMAQAEHREQTPGAHSVAVMRMCCLDAQIRGRKLTWVAGTQRLWFVHITSHLQGSPASHGLLPPVTQHGQNASCLWGAFGNCSRHHIRMQDAQDVRPRQDWPCPPSSTSGLGHQISPLWNTFPLF